MRPRKLGISLLGTALLVGACAELTRPPRPEPPTELAGGLVADPLPAILDAAARDFDRAGAGLDGRPQATALALARLEWMSGEAQPGRRLSSLPQSFIFALNAAVEEGRRSVGVAPGATPEATVPALLTASRALGRSDEAAASAALAPPVFTATGRPVVSRLREPGAFPNAGLAVIAIRDELVRRDAENRADRRLTFDNPGAGVTTFGLGGNTDR